MRDKWRVRERRPCHLTHSQWQRVYQTSSSFAFTCQCNNRIAKNGISAALAVTPSSGERLGVPLKLKLSIELSLSTRQTHIDIVSIPSAPFLPLSIPPRVLHASRMVVYSPSSSCRVFEPRRLIDMAADMQIVQNNHLHLYHKQTLTGKYPSRLCYYQRASSWNLTNLQR